MLLFALSSSSEFNRALLLWKDDQTACPCLSGLIPVFFSFLFFLTLLIIKAFPFYYVSLFSHLLSLWEICMPLFLGKKVMTAISFLFSPSLAVWVFRLVAPAKATGARMRSEREQLIKSSSSRSTESQFCLPSTMISFYLKVMSYGTFASGNTMSSISMFHLLHKQGQVIPAGFYLAIKAIGCTARRRGERGRAERKKGGLHVFLFITSQWKNWNRVQRSNLLFSAAPSARRETVYECFVTLLMSQPETSECGICNSM